MKTQNNKKRLYLSPIIECVELDNEISLVLESAPPAGPGEPGYIGKIPDCFNNDPFKSTIC
jgi:hypothetical protein